MQKLFAHDPDFIFLNAGSLSKTPLSVLARVQDYQREIELNPTLAIFQSYSRAWEVQKKLARFFHADPKDLFLRSNITAALNTFFLGVKLEKGFEILTTDFEYGATLNIAKLKAQQVGASVRSVSLFPGIDAAKITQQQLVEKIEAELKPNTKMLLVSHVSTGQGIIFPIEELAELCHSKGITFVVDGAHAAASIPLNFEQLQKVSFYGGNLHKWMMGPKGTAFGWISPRTRGHFTPQEAGWGTFETPAFYQNFGDGDHLTAALWPSGTTDYSPFYGISDILDFWQEHGEAAIRAKIYEKQNFLADLMRKNLPEWKLLSPEDSSMRGPILAYELSEPFSRMGVDFAHLAYKKHQLQIASPNIKGHTVLRLTPHVYTTEEEMERAVSVLQRIVASMA